MVGIGTAGGGTFASAAEANTWWKQQVASAHIQSDETLSAEPMAGPVAFISFPFAPTGQYEVVVPRIVIGRRHGQSWLTSWDGATLVTPPSPTRALPHLDFQTGHLDRDHWMAAVRGILNHIQDGSVDKVVLARDETATATTEIDPRPVLATLAASYPQTWTFYVKHLVGATPELLVRQTAGQITSRVLAGTIPGNPASTSLADALRTSEKDLAEHHYALASVVQALTGHATNLKVPDHPFVLRLPNVMHLASDVTGTVRPGGSVIELADLIHPTAAVCGTPTAQARAIITELEGMDRNRYAGPVGWVNATGDGEIALALRCGLIEGTQVRIFAGGGIVADSDPATEWDETVAKLQPMKQVFMP